MITDLIRRAYRLCFARACMQKLNKLLLDCALSGLGVLNFETLKLSGEAHFLEKVVLPRLPLRKTIFDVGANSGNYSFELRKLFKDADIHAFEPNPRAFSNLKVRNIAGVKVNNVGLSNNAGSFELYDRNDDSGSEHASLYAGVIGEIHHQTASPVTVELKTLDGYCRENLVDRIDFLKIDTEGHELQVLLGASVLIANKKIGLVQIEFNEMNVISRVFVRDIMKILPSHDFYRLLPGGMIKLNNISRHTEIYAFQNIVGIPN
jgi:FkbM family methyltransferase